MKIITKQFNAWKVINNKVKVLNRDKFLLCRCSLCGTERLVRLKNLKSGGSKNCGCVRNKKTRERNYKHGKRFNKVWSVWNDMKQRCYNKNNKSYKNYGGRGIIVCDDWVNSFESFYEYMGDVPEGDYSIDRIDNNGNYEPKNVRWATRKTQSRNRRSNRKINGVCITDIDKSLNGKNGLVGKRLKRGWTLEKAITTKSNASLQN